MVSKVLVEPAIEPVSLLQAKAWLRLDITAEDALVSQLIMTARIRSEAVTRRAFISQSIREIAKANPETGIVDLDVLPLQSISEIAEIHADGSEQILAAEAYVVDSDNGRVLLQQSHANTSYRLSYIAGYGDSAEDVPAPLKTAILLQVGWLFEHREEDGATMPHAAQILLANYTRVRL
ncbi:hypothetical protein MNBD_ALPHA06-751 [hydrothermal vent metagenome]|uniref:Phage gp6-like head-tail connector protein n=1 Tax=hydrothermal vent metagenome TaxID=652676 RepID=A0A3B0SGD2_9ZZZZ